MTVNERVSIFVSHKVATHRRAAERIKTVLESRTERLDVYVCEDIPAGERWQEWIESRISHSQMLLVLWPLEDGLDLTWIGDEIHKFKQACPRGRLVVLKADRTLIPEIVKDFQWVDVRQDELAERLLKPLYTDASFMKLALPLNGRISADDVRRDAEEIERAYTGLEETRVEQYRELLIVEIPERGGLERAQVRAPYGCVSILNWNNKKSFTWKELRARASEEKTRGKFWVSEMENVMFAIERGDAPDVMTSTFRGRGKTSGRIFQPQLEKVDFSEDVPIRFSFGFHEVLVPELVRGPGAIGDVFNLIHLAVRVRWEVLNPFLLNLGTPRARREITTEDRNAVIAKVSGSLRAIDLEAARHNMLEAAAFDAFEGEDRHEVMAMLRGRESIKEAIAHAVQMNDFDELMRNLACALEPNAKATELLTEKFLELLRKDHERIAQLRTECLAVSMTAEV